MIIAKKNAIYYHCFAAVDSAIPDKFKSGLTVADEAYYKDGAGAWTALSISDTYSEIGTTGLYVLVATAAEFNHDKVMIKLTAAGMADDFVFFDLRAKLVDDLNDFNVSTENVTLAAVTHTGAIIPTVSTVTNAITLPAIPTNWITATGINSGALNGKGDWNIGKTGYSISGTITTLDGLNNLSFSDVWTGTLTESYAANLAEMTPAQAFYMIWSDLRSSNQVGLVWSDYKVDNTTVSMTFGLDDATVTTRKTRTL